MKRLLLSGSICVSLLSPVVQAELTSMDDTELSRVSGQAGLSMEVQTKMSIGEIAYQDQGYLVVQDFALGGFNGSNLDNLLVNIDVAGDGEVLPYGFSRMSANTGQGSVSGKQFNDGDLVIHMDSLDYGSDFATATDFELNIGGLYNTASDYTVGSMTPSGTANFTDINIQGYLGPVDVVVRNADGSQVQVNDNMTASNQRMEVEAHFSVTEMSFNWDTADILIIFNLANLQIHDMKIHNRRGEDTAGHFGMASAKATFGRATSLSNGVTGLGVYDAELRADIDIVDSQFGNTPTIGKIHFTDFVVTGDMVVYGH